MASVQDLQQGTDKGEQHHSQCGVDHDVQVLPGDTLSSMVWIIWGMNRLQTTIPSRNNFETVKRRVTLLPLLAKRTNRRMLFIVFDLLSLPSDLQFMQRCGRKELPFVPPFCRNLAYSSRSRYLCTTVAFFVTAQASQF
jgi:hypothetical protein